MTSSGLDFKDASIIDNVNDCKWVTKYTTNVEQLIYQNGGMDLHQLVVNFKLLDDHFFIDNLIQLFVPLLKGLEDLNDQKLTHCDIKPPNMLYNFELNKPKLDSNIDRVLNETDWSILNILIKDPTVMNKQISEKANLSIDGVGSSLRRMYEYFEIKETKYKKIALLHKVIKISQSN